jgi:hypothetical protein
MTECHDDHGYTDLDGNWKRGPGPRTDRQVLITGGGGGILAYLSLYNQIFIKITRSRQQAAGSAGEIDHPQ